MNSLEKKNLLGRNENEKQKIKGYSMLVNGELYASYFQHKQDI